MHKLSRNGRKAAGFIYGDIRKLQMELSKHEASFE
jgi:hypothetical protein